MTSSKLDATTNKWLRLNEHVKISWIDRFVMQFKNNSELIKKMKTFLLSPAWMMRNLLKMEHSSCVTYKIKRESRKGIGKLYYAASKKILSVPFFSLSLPPSTTSWSQKKDLFKRQLQFPSSCSSLIWMLYNFFYTKKKYKEKKEKNLVPSGQSINLSMFQQKPRVTGF